MKLKPGFTIQHIGSTCYILPYGQNIANHRRGFSFNGVGEYVIELINREMSREGLRSEYLKHFMAGPEERSELINDLDQFLDQLISGGFIEDDAAPLGSGEQPRAYLNIGGLTIAYCGPRELIDASFLKDFCVEPCENTELRVFVDRGSSDSAEDGDILLRCGELIVSERERDYLLRFPSFSQIREVELLKDGSSAVFHCASPYTEVLGEEFFHALRHVFLYLAAKHSMYAIHSASLCYQGKAWLFSASSGTGKSTHTNMWKELYDIELLNGDLNLLTIENGRPVVHGIPWCGTSEIFTKKTVPLGGIILLKQAADDTIEELPPDKQALLVMQRFISPMWTAGQLKESVSFAEELTKEILVCRLRCTKNNSAAGLSKSRIDRELCE